MDFPKKWIMKSFTSILSPRICLFLWTQKSDAPVFLRDAILAMAKAHLGIAFHIFVAIMKTVISHEFRKLTAFITRNQRRPQRHFIEYLQRFEDCPEHTM
uniref:Secreted protein n=1 Tax=Panagrellus redivivus TaxID=6233 RepID=A0A7E4WAH5_PANRE